MLNYLNLFYIDIKNIIVTERNSYYLDKPPQDSLNEDILYKFDFLSVTKIFLEEGKSSLREYRLIYENITDLQAQKQENSN